MKHVFALYLILFSINSYASFGSYEFEGKDIVIIDSKTGIPAEVKEFVVYYTYDFFCLLDGGRPSRCVDGPTQILPVFNGRISLESQVVEKKFLTGKNPRIGLQVSGAGLKWFSLQEFNNSSNPLRLEFSFYK